MAAGLPQIYWNRNSLLQSSVEGWLHTIPAPRVTPPAQLSAGARPAAQPLPGPGPQPPAPSSEKLITAGEVRCSWEWQGAQCRVRGLSRNQLQLAPGFLGAASGEGERGPRPELGRGCGRCYESREPQEEVVSGLEPRPAPERSEQRGLLLSSWDGSAAASHSPEPSLVTQHWPQAQAGPLPVQGSGVVGRGTRA